MRYQPCRSLQERVSTPLALGLTPFLASVSLPHRLGTSGPGCSLVVAEAKLLDGEGSPPGPHPRPPTHAGRHVREARLNRHDNDGSLPNPVSWDKSPLPWLPRDSMTSLLCRRPTTLLPVPTPTSPTSA